MCKCVIEISYVNFAWGKVWDTVRICNDRTILFYMGTERPNLSEFKNVGEIDKNKWNKEWLTRIEKANRNFIKTPAVMFDAGSTIIRLCDGTVLAEFGKKTEYMDNKYAKWLVVEMRELLHAYSKQNMTMLR